MTTVCAGAIGDSERIPGCVWSVKPSQYYIGFWKCQQANGDGDDDQLTDSSGNDAHATIGTLTSAEAWASTGYFTTLNASGKHAVLPTALWTPRFTTHSWAIGFRGIVTPEASAASVLGNSTGATNTGFRLRSSTGGKAAFYIDRTSGAQDLGNSSITAFEAGVVHDVLLGYTLSDNSVRIFVDGVEDSNYSGDNETVSNPDLIDAGTFLDLRIGGRAAADSMACQLAWIHAFAVLGRDFTDLAAMAVRLHRFPSIALSDREVA